MLQSYSMRFDGHLLNRGFWLYVWEIKGPLSHHVYVGRTGDSSSPHASSPFKRIGQHLDPRPNAKGNALGKQLKHAGVKHEECSFEMVAIGPIWPEQADFEAHRPDRDQMAALEHAVADELRAARVSGARHASPSWYPGSGRTAATPAILDPKFPVVAKPNRALQQPTGA